MAVNEPSFSDAPEIQRFAEAGARALQRCDALAAITDEPGRITRTFLSPATRRAQELVKRWMEGAGLAVHVDAAGNLIGRREVAGKRTLAIGSHLDTVPNAGKYDGILGVMAGIALAELTLDEALPFGLEVVGFSEEEGVRFGRPYIGSHAYAGTLDAAWLELKDKEGVTVEAAIRAFGLDPSPLKSLRPRMDLLGYLELHIEQGPVLEAKGLPLGIVTAIAAQTRLTMELTGQAAHAGTTPMELRRDALTCAAEIILAIEKIGREKIPGVATVGRIEALPNASNVVPETVRFSVDVRNESASQQEEAVWMVMGAAEEIAVRRGVELRVGGRSDFPPTPMNGAPFLLSPSDESLFQMISGAGHDAVIMAAVTKVAMLFVRSPAGISHNPAEAVVENDVALALQVLHKTILSLKDDS